MTTIEPISLSHLVRPRANVRHTARTLGIKELMASIDAHGLRQNLSMQDEPFPWPAIHKRIARALDVKPPSHLSHMCHMR